MRYLNRSGRMGGEIGSAMIEFMLFGVLLLVPMTLGLADVANYYSVLMAGENAAREAARAFVLTPTAREANAKSRAMAITVLADSRARYRNLNLRIECSASPCLTPGASVRVVLDLQARLRIVSTPVHVEEIEPVASWVPKR